ncbi:hypothetical protein DX914_12715 [Lysobacter silvisoli]|uniref:Uncharacterized protein n=1 Tax=Lysobacter silvisoli TaxID=2293254 RepID=A0A371JZM7_9GAMM|nr:hypothetical protein DX914_12715 [Lysobacter silvisoli]
MATTRGAIAARPALRSAAATGSTLAGFAGAAGAAGAGSGAAGAAAGAGAASVLAASDELSFQQPAVAAIAKAPARPNASFLFMVVMSRFVRRYAAVVRGRRRGAAGRVQAQDSS